MNEPDKPKPLDPTAIAGQQRTENRDNAYFNANMNRLNQTDQFGNTLNFSQSGRDSRGNPIFSASQGLGGPGQMFSEGLAGLGSQYFEGANKLLGNRGDLGSQGAFDNAYQTATANITPRFDRSRDQLDNRLRNQGLDPSSEAYRNAMNDQALQQNEALNSLTTQLQGQVFNQGLADRNQQVGEFQSLTNPALQFGQQAINPSYVSVPGIGTNPVDHTGLELARQNQLQQNYQSDVAQNNAMMGGLAAIGGQILTLPFGGFGSGIA